MNINNNLDPSSMQNLNNRPNREELQNPPPLDLESQEQLLLHSTV